MFIKHFLIDFFDKGEVFKINFISGKKYNKMNIQKELIKKKKTLVHQWFKAVINTYASDTAQFLESQKDLFANPVGNTILNGLTMLFDEMTGSMDKEKIVEFLDPIIRVRAVQTFAPSKAVAFLYTLKVIIRDNFKGSLKDKTFVKELLELELNIDRLALIGFDVYMECRESLNSIRANQEKKKVYKAFKRAGLITDSQ